MRDDLEAEMKELEWTGPKVPAWRETRDLEANRCDTQPQWARSLGQSATQHLVIFIQTEAVVI